MMKRLVGVILATLLAVTACSDPGKENEGVSIPISIPSGTVISQPADPPASAYARLQSISTASDCHVVGDLEGRFTKSQMPQYLACVVPNIDRWIDSTYPAMEHPKGYYFIPSGVSDVLVTAEGNCPLNDEVLQYCSGVDQIFLGQKAVWQQYSLYGEAAPSAVVAHELGHHFQHVVKMTRAMGNAQIRYENQADCVAGAYIAWARGHGVMSKSDVRNLSGSLIDASEADGPGRDHG